MSSIYIPKHITLSLKLTKLWNTHIEKAKNVSTKEEANETVEVFKKLLKDRDNRPYLDELYFQLGTLENENNLENAIKFFKKSLRASNTINLQKELTYLAVGDLYFEQAEFVIAGAYYDSILNITKEENTKRIRRLTRKRNNLNEVIFYENIARVNDSILKVNGMSNEERTSFFEKHIESLKKLEEQTDLHSSTGSSFYKSDISNDKDQGSGKWYFYNFQAVGFGSQEFIKRWGNRPLEDGWRLSDKTIINIGKTNVDNSSKISESSTSEKFQLSYYLKKIITDKSKTDSIIRERNEAYFKLGIIYKEQFKEVDLAVARLEKLRTFNPVETILLPTIYHLYKIYSNQNSDKAEILKNDIINNYPTSNYAKIILNPNEILNDETEITPEDEYALVYYEYKDELFESVIKKSIIAIQKYQGQKIVAKFELLKAYAVGKKEGVIAFKDALDIVAMNYPNTEEGKKALEIIEAIKAKL